MLRLFTYLFIFTLSFTLAKANEGLDLKLIASSDTIVPSKPFTIGLHIQHYEGFHTYWKNPGLVGIPTTLDWNLPSGFRASHISWPYPELIKMASYPCHGYERDITLLVTISPPAKIKKSQITLTTKAEWMSCSHQCHHGQRELSLTLPVGEKIIPNLPSQKLIDQAKKEVPLFTKNWRMEILSQVDEDPIRISFRSPQKGQPDYLFSQDGQISSDQKQVFENISPGHWILSIKRSEYSPKSKASLPAVLKAGKHYYTLIAPFKKPPPR